MRKYWKKNSKNQQQSSHKDTQIVTPRQAPTDQLTIIYMSTTPQYLTIEQAAEYLNVTVKCIRKWIEAKRIDYVKMGKYVRFRKEYLDQWVEKNTIKATKKIA